MNFILDNRSGKKKYDCPNCHHKKKFTRYVHPETFEELNDDVGKCDRIEKCNYHYHYSEYFKNNPNIDKSAYISNKPTTFIVKETSFINKKYFEASVKLNSGKYNNFHVFLIRSFGKYIADNLIKRYRVGNSSHWNNTGANVFWLVDIDQKIRSGKIMLYDSIKGKRNKVFNWVHILLKKKGLIPGEFNLKQCFFGEHILMYEPNEPIAIVESEKTAMICYLFHPDFIWLACGSANGLNIEKCKVLKGRKVVLFPDVSQYKYWKLKADEIHQALGLNISVDDFLEKRVPEAFKKDFSDLADFYLKDKNELGEVMFDDVQTMREYLMNNCGEWEDSAQ
ncbi:MAG: DUF6371 domain-containing protein [Bacteroidota bacterium]|nr:DUF6371 domain-containing protein [Bacteroidota bacterium]